MTQPATREGARPETAAAEPGPRVGRRSFLLGAGAVLAAGAAGKILYDRAQRLAPAEVFIAKAASYESDLVVPLRDALEALGVGRSLVRGRRVLLKPNLVEPSLEAPHINTHPAVVRAAAEVFRTLDAREVLVAEGQGHCRDTYLVLEQSGMGPMLKEAGLSFIDLNHDELTAAPNVLGATGLAELVLPQTLRQVDLVVSMPKLKTHHWAGVTLSMKNLFGIMPGIFYGWPKNVLHMRGIENSILDINATVQPQLAIVDGIVGMEGDGPIMGTPKQAGVLIVGDNLPAVDATATRVMGLDPSRVRYLAAVDERLGPISEHRIAQLGEPVGSVAHPFQLLDHPSFDYLRT